MTYRLLSDKKILKAQNITLRSEIETLTYKLDQL